jgi:hypothetical protein
MPARSLSLLLVGASFVLATVGCSKEPSTQVTGPQFPGAGGAGATTPSGPALPGAPTTAGPPSTFRQTEPCVALYQFQQLGYNAGVSTDKAKQQELYTAAVTSGADLKVKVAAIAADVDLTLVLLKKHVDGTLTEADKADQAKAATALDAYWKANCL